MEKFVISDNRLFKISWEELDAKSIYMKRVNRDDVSRVKAVVWEEEDSINGAIKVADKEETLKTIKKCSKNAFVEVFRKTDDGSYWISKHDDFDKSCGVIWVTASDVLNAYSDNRIGENITKYGSVEKAIEHLAKHMLRAYSNRYTALIKYTTVVCNAEELRLVDNKVVHVPVYKDYRQRVYKWSNSKGLAVDLMEQFAGTRDGDSFTEKQLDRVASIVACGSATTFCILHLLDLCFSNGSNGAELVRYLLNREPSDSLDVMTLVGKYDKCRYYSDEEGTHRVGIRHLALAKNQVMTAFSSSFHTLIVVRYDGAPIMQGNVLRIIARRFLTPEMIKSAVMTGDTDVYNVWTEEENEEHTIRLTGKATSTTHKTLGLAAEEVLRVQLVTTLIKLLKQYAGVEYRVTAIEGGFVAEYKWGGESTWWYDSTINLKTTWIVEDRSIGSVCGEETLYKRLTKENTSPLKIVDVVSKEMYGGIKLHRTRV